MPSSQPSITTATEAIQARNNNNRPPTTVARNLETTLSFAFFDGAPVRQPTDKEIDGLLVQTHRFYTQVFSSSNFGKTFIDVVLDVNRVDFDASQVVVGALLAGADAESSFPITVVTDVTVSFGEAASGGQEVPSSDQLVMILQAANYVDYIQDYVWVADPPGGEGLFFETQVVQFDGMAV